MTYSLLLANTKVLPRLLFQIGIACRLNDPSQVLIDLYGPIIIRAVLIATYFLIGVVGCCVIPFAVVLLSREFCTINVVELD